MTFLRSRLSRHKNLWSFKLLVALTCMLFVVHRSWPIPSQRNGLEGTSSNVKPALYEVRNADEKKTYTVTLVTGYFPLKKSKHSFEEYENWINNFLPKITSPIVIFVDKRNATSFMEKRMGKPTVILEYDNVWDLPPISKFKDNYINKQNELDPEKQIHYPGLYAVWNSKSWMLSHVTELNPFNSTYFFWVDMGCFRDQITPNHYFVNWPDIDRVNEVFKNGTLNNFHVFAVDKYHDNTTDYKYQYLRWTLDILIGTFFGGTAKAIQSWSKMYYEVHEDFLNKGLFVGKEQNLMNYVAIKLKNEIIVTTAFGENYDYKGNVWFYFQDWYANENERYPNYTNTPYIDMVDFIRY